MVESIVAGEERQACGRRAPEDGAREKLADNNEKQSDIIKIVHTATHDHK
jgi:hypothetical protein